jgi:DNA-binding SARP family transcriptional activator
MVKLRSNSGIVQEHNKLPTIHIYAFGTLQVVRNNHAVSEGDWHTRQARQLLKILLTERPRPVSTDRLIEILWPSSTPEAAATTLRSAINALRNVLEPERANRAPSNYIVTQTPGYAFRLHPDIWLDVEVFDRTLNTAQHSNNPLLRKQIFLDAVELYQDDYLVSDPYADWASIERERLRERYFNALLQLAELQAQDGDYGEAISTVRRILARDEVRENAYQSLMRYQAESGDSAGALLTYERCRTILADELGADPSPLTQLWHQRILNGEVAPHSTTLLGASALRVLSAAGSPASPLDGSQATELDGDHGGGMAMERHTALLNLLPQQTLMPSVDARYGDILVGREDELNQIGHRLRQALTGKGDLLVLEGEAGVGKTRLALAILSQAVEAHATVISAACQALEKTLPFAPLADCLGRYFHRLPDEALSLLPLASLAQLTQIIPSLQDRAPGAQPPPVDVLTNAEEYRQRLIDGIASVLTTLAELRPLVIFLDDLHWADADTLAVLSRLCQRLADLPFFLMLAYRSDDLVENDALATLLHALRRSGGERFVEVARLNPPQVQQFIDLAVGEENAFGGELARLIYETTQGNPLFVAESLRDLQERHPDVLQAALDGVEGRSQTAWLNDIRHVLTLRRNQHVQELILERIERLPDKALWVLQLSSVIARDYSLELLETAATEDPLAGLETLLERNFLFERHDQRIDFSHGVVRQVAYDSMSALQRRRWHQRVADALVRLRRAEHNPAEAAFHYGQAGANARFPFARFSVLVGEKLLRTYSHRQAIERFDAALNALDQLADPSYELMQRALLGRGLAYESLFDPEGVTESYRRLQAFAVEKGDRDLLLRAHSRLASVLGLLGQDRESNELLRRLIDILSSGDAAHQMRSHVISDLLERRRIIYSEDEDTGATWEEYMPPPPVVADPVDDILQVLEPLHAVLPLFDYGWTLLVQGQLGEATRCLSAVVDLASETAQPSIASTALHQLAVTARILGNLEQSQTLNEQSIAINREVSGVASELASMWPRISSAILSLQAGRIDEAERRLRRVVDFLGAGQLYRNYRNSANIGLGLVALARGDLPIARMLLEGALSDPVNLYPYMHVRALLGLARIAHEEGDAVTAESLLRQSLRFAGRRSLLEEYIETLLEIAYQRAPGAPIEHLVGQMLDYLAPVHLDAPMRRLQAALVTPQS